MFDFSVVSHHRSLSSETRIRNLDFFRLEYKMPKTIRPERVFADHEEDAIVVEYIIQKFDDSDCQVS